MGDKDHANQYNYLIKLIIMKINFNINNSKINDISNSDGKKKIFASTIMIEV